MQCFEGLNDSQELLIMSFVLNLSGDYLSREKGYWMLLTNFRLRRNRIKVFICQGLKEKDSIWVILKESKSWGEKKEERKLDTSWKRYTRRYHKHANKAFRFP